MFRKFIVVSACLSVFLVSIPRLVLSQDDRIGQAAVDAIKAQMRMAKGMEIKFIEKKESPITDFFQVKLLLSYPDREIPVILYVDKTGEKVIMGNLIVRGENLTKKEAGEAKPRRIEVGQLEIEKSPFRGAPGAKVTMVEFANFQCPFCVKGWPKTKELLDKNPQAIRYVFKCFPQQGQAKSVELCELAAAAQEVSNEAFWTVHDYLFTEEGQTLVKGEKEAVKQKVEQVLKDKGMDVKNFRFALESGKAKKRVEEDMALGTKYRIPGTPVTIVNGDMIRGPLNEKMLAERYLGK